MFIIRNRMDHESSWPAERHTEFLKQCEAYINGLTAEGRLISAQPLEREGTMVSGRAGAWQERPFNEADEVQVGYYRIRADNLGEAIAIAKRNPEFAFSSTARIEVRPIKGAEVSTKFTYPG